MKKIMNIVSVIMAANVIGSVTVNAQAEEREFDYSIADIIYAAKQAETDNVASMVVLEMQNDKYRVFVYKQNDDIKTDFVWIDPDRDGWDQLIEAFQYLNEIEAL